MARQVRQPPLANMTLTRAESRVARSIASGHVVADPSWRDQFETELAAAVGVRHAFAFEAGRVALRMILRAMQVGPGDEVVVPAYTCVVVPNAVTSLGATPVYVDVEPRTYGIDASQLQDVITPRTAAVIHQHLFGIPAWDTDEVLDLCRERGIYVIEDIAHSLGASHAGHKVGSLGDAAFVSTERSKTISTILGGAALVTNHDVADRLCRLAAAASSPSRDEVQSLLAEIVRSERLTRRSTRGVTVVRRAAARRLGVARRDTVSTSRAEEHGAWVMEDRRMPKELARVALPQLRRLDATNQSRREAASAWRSWVEHHGFEDATVRSADTAVYLRYPVLVPREVKADVPRLERTLGVPVGVWFTSHLHPRLRLEGYPVADRLVETMINLPTLGVPPTAFERRPRP